MVPHATWLAGLGRVSIPRLVTAVVTACVLGGTAIADTPVLAAPAGMPTTVAPRTPAACDMPDDQGLLELGAVMQVIAHCQEILALSEAQREQLDTVGAAFIEDVVQREARREVVEHALATLLRPDPEDPGRPVDLEAAEARIRELERLTADQDIAALRAVEASKALLTDAQRATLASLLAAPRAARAPRIDL
jgi:hypothetical protein